MELKTKFFHELTTSQLYEILKARAEIFIVEQQCVYQDLDEKDYDALHIFCETEGKVIAYLRAYKKENDNHTIQLGRVLTLTHGAGLGRTILKHGIAEVCRLMDAKKIYIEAQSYAVGFYEKEGFKVCSNEFLEDGIPHVEMVLEC